MLLLLLISSVGPLENLYNAWQYEQVVAQAPAALAAAGTTREDSIRIFEFDAFSLVALGRSREAAEVFRQALVLNPNLELDPSTTSPKIRAVFDQVKQDAPVPGLRPLPARHETVYVRQPIPLSVLVPGLSQIQNRHEAKGIALLSAFVISGAGIGLSQVNYDQAHQQYLQATEPGVIESRYRTSNAWFKARTVFISSTGVVWLASLLDAILR